MRLFPRLLLPAALLLALAACSDDEPEAPAPQAETTAEAAPVKATRVGEANERLQLLKTEPQGVQTATGPVMDASIRDTLRMNFGRGHRKAAHVARDPYRHPMETLEFFGLQHGMRVVEITPGTGYWTELLSPTLKNAGTYVALLPDESVPPEVQEEVKMLRARMAAQRKHYGRAEIIKFNPAQPVFGPPASADMVLTFRNAHNWVEEGTAPAYFKAIASVLKPGGVLGLEDHRAPEGEPTDGSRGYVTEEQIIQLAAEAGFVLADKSEINANPKDTKDHPDGVWSLPPTLAGGEKDRDKYVQIGESDRMTLKFIKQ
jgi:predicted methyltransferase